jgi:hypothetical protein
VEIQSNYVAQRGGERVLGQLKTPHPERPKVMLICLLRVPSRLGARGHESATGTLW